MPVCTLHLLSLSTSPDWLLHQVAKEHKVLLASRFRSPPPIIRVGDNSPNADLINETSWSLLLILESEAPSPLSGKAALSSSIREEIIFRTGIPSKLTASLHDRVQQLLSESRERRRNVQLGKNQLPTLIPQVAAPAPLAPDSQNLELSDGLLQFARSLTEAQRDEAFNENASSSAVWMLNLLKFKIGEESKKSYIEYGKRFAQVSRQFGGSVVLVGSVLSPASASSPSSSPPYWEEFALAHYPSIDDFCDMAASSEYQAINTQYRLPSLQDTGILCTTPLVASMAQDVSRSKL